MTDAAWTDAINAQLDEAGPWTQEQVERIAALWRSLAVNEG